MQFFHFSNKMDALAGLLIGQIKQLEPFSKLTVVVASEAIKNYLKMQIVDKLGICMNVQFAFIQPTVFKLTQILFQDVKAESQVELALKLEMLIPKMLHQGKFAPLKKYLQRSEKADSLDEKKLTTLSDHLASEFITYSLYSHHVLKQLEEQQEMQWQAPLFKQLFEALSVNSDPWEVIQQPIIAPGQKMSFFFFGFSFMPQPFFELTQAAAKSCNVQYFLQKPTCLFWSDVLSQKESKKQLRFFERQNKASTAIEALAGYLSETNPLLANCGELGRKWHSLFEDREALELYFTSKEIHNIPQYQESSGLPELKLTDQNLTLLSALQTDLLLMRSVSEPVEVNESDSIQIHQASTHEREVEVLYYRIQKLLDHDVNLRPRDITVYIYNIDQYLPFLEKFFDPSASKVEATLHSSSFSQKNKVLKSVLFFLHFIHSKKNQEDWLELLCSPGFKEKHQICENHLSKWEGWFKELGPFWGWDQNDQADRIQQEYDQQYSKLCSYDSLETVLACLIHKMCSDEPGFPYHYQSQVQFSNASELNLLLQIAIELKQDLTHLLNEKRSLAQWAQYLQELLQKHFQFQDADLADFEAIQSKISSFAKRFEQLELDPLSFDTFFYYLKKELLDFETKSSQTQYEAVQIYDASNCSPAPAKMVCVLGLNDQSFPRQLQPSPLSLWPSFKDKLYKPSLVDYDKYCFLEYIMAASDHLHLSYLGYCSETYKQMQPSSLLLELIQYLDQFFTVQSNLPSKQIHLKHSHFGWDFHNFQKPSYDTQNYQLAKSYYLQEKSQACFVAEVNSELSSRIDCNQVDLKDLLAAVRNPIQFSLKKVHRIQFDGPDFTHRYQNFNLNPIQRSVLEKESIFKMPVSSSQLPVKGYYKEMAMDKLATAHQAQLDFLKMRGLEADDFFAVELQEGIDTATQLSANHWLHPPLEIQLSPGKSVQLVGHLEGMTSKGLTCFAKCDPSSLWTYFPLYAASKLVSKGITQIEDCQWLFLRSKKQRSIQLKDPETILKAYLNFYFIALNHVTPFMPQWIAAYLKEDQSALTKKIQSDLNSRYFFHPEISYWLKDKEIDALTSPHWQNCAACLFNPLYEALNESV